MMHQPLASASLRRRRLERPTAHQTGWCILRTAGPRTLMLAKSLDEAAIEVWTPRRTFKRPVAGAKPDAHGRRPTQEMEAPILPTFVFARACHLPLLEELERNQQAAHVASAHPPFSVFRYQGSAPFVGHSEIAGFQDEERKEAETLERIRAAETREEADRIRIAALRDEQARRRAQKAADRARRIAMQAERAAAIKSGDSVTVELPAFAGMTGVVASMDGRWAMVIFGETFSMKVEAWQLASNPVQASQS